MYNGPMIRKELVAASAEPLILSLLAKGESYGYAILRRINELSEGELDWTEGLVYPLLHRLERLGYVESSWRSVAGERRRQSRPTPPTARGAVSPGSRRGAGARGIPPPGRDGRRGGSGTDGEPRPGSGGAAGGG